MSKDKRRNSTITTSYITTTSKNTEYNEIHYAAWTNPMGALRRRPFGHANDPWEGETLALKVALIEATENWEKLTGGGVPCPVVFDAEDVRETMKLDQVQRRADETLEKGENMIGFGWVPTECYEGAMTRCKQLREGALESAASAEERAEIYTHWVWDDMDEEKYV